MAKSPLQDEPTSAEHSQDKSWSLDGLPHVSNGFDELPAEQGEQSSRQSPSDWRDGCGKSASPVWRQGRRNSLRCPYLDLSSLASFARACFRRIIARKIVGLVRSTLVRTDTLCHHYLPGICPCPSVQRYLRLLSRDLISRCYGRERARTRQRRTSRRGVSASRSVFPASDSHIVQCRTISTCRGAFAGHLDRQGSRRLGGGGYATSADLARGFA